MKKKSGDEKRPIQVDTVSGEYYVTIPEWIMNELSWYEDTEINFLIENGDVIISECNE
jgi:antitoxin component of MazEF toxin-antitoxin module